MPSSSVSDAALAVLRFRYHCPAVLYIFAGLPGSGKTTVAKALARIRRAVYLRVDTLEQTLRREGVDVVAHGYAAAMAIATDNLDLGMAVVIDSVNPWPLTRAAYRAVAQKAGCPFVDIEVRCSDETEHRRRLAERANDIEGLRRVSWEDVCRRDYRPWNKEPLRLDTAGKSIDETTQELLERLATETLSQA